jgi:hypothetical protein
MPSFARLISGLREDKNPQEVIYDPSSPAGEPAADARGKTSAVRPAAPDASKPARDGSLMFQGAA